MDNDVVIEASPFRSRRKTQRRNSDSGSLSSGDGDNVEVSMEVDSEKNR